MTQRDDGFYVGYLPTAPPSVAAFVRRVIGGIAIVAVAVAVVVAMVQSRLDAVTFEYGHPRPFTGSITTDPFPALRVPLPGGGGPAARLALVNRGKHGALEEVSAHAGHRVELSGTLIYRNAGAMLELVPGSVHRIDTIPQVPPDEPEALGTVTLVGEIVDAKCYLGVMNPGNSVVHRACAIRCLSGGIPAMLALADSGGRTVVWLANPQRPTSPELLAHVAERISITGELWAYENLLVLVPDPTSLRPARRP